MNKRCKRFLHTGKDFTSTICKEIIFFLLKNLNIHTLLYLALISAKLLFPSNTTIYHQPINQRIIQNLKIH